MLIILENAPAKINLGLKIINKRADGYHNILSIFQTVDLYDELELNLLHKPGLYCTNPSLPTGQENIVLQAENLFREHHGDIPGVHFTLRKYIPVGAGLAGGSSDAAAALRGLKTLHGIDISNETLNEYACELGSDVPFLMNERTSIVSGRGEIIVDVEWPFDFYYVFVYPKFSISTSWAYGNLKKTGKDYKAYQDLTERLKTGRIDVDEFFDVIDNDFEESVFEKYPLLYTIKKQLMNQGARAALLSGSGSTVFGIFEDAETAEKCAHSLKNIKYEIFIVKSSS